MAATSDWPNTRGRSAHTRTNARTHAHSTSPLPPSALVRTEMALTTAKAAKLLASCMVAIANGHCFAFPISGDLYLSVRQQSHLLHLRTGAAIRMCVACRCRALLRMSLHLAGLPCPACAASTSTMGDLPCCARLHEMGLSLRRPLGE